MIKRFLVRIGLMIAEHEHRYTIKCDNQLMRCDFPGCRMHTDPFIEERFKADNERLNIQIDKINELYAKMGRELIPRL